MSFTVTVLVVVTHPSSAALGRAFVNTEHTHVLALTVQAHHVVSTLSSCQDQTRIGHVISKINVRPPAQNPAPFLKRDVGLYGNSICTDDGTVCPALTLYLATFSIPWLTFGEQPLVVFSTVAVRVSSRVDPLEADTWGWLSSLSPQSDALLLMRLADSIVAVAVHTEAGVTVMKVNVGGTVRARPGTKLRQVTRVTGLATRRPGWLQLTLMAALSMGAHSLPFQSTRGGITARIHTLLWLSTVALLALLHIAVATFLSSVEHFDFRHVEEAHAHALLKTGRQVLLTAAAEDSGKRVPGGGGHDAAATVHCHPAATASLRSVMVHPKIVSELVGQSDGCTERVIRMVHDYASGLLGRAHAHDGGHADGGALKVHPTDELSVVMLFLGQQFDLSPV